MIVQGFYKFVVFSRIKDIETPLEDVLPDIKDRLISKITLKITSLISNLTSEVECFTEKVSFLSDEYEKVEEKICDRNFISEEQLLTKSQGMPSLQGCQIAHKSLNIFRCPFYNDYLNFFSIWQSLFCLCQSFSNLSTKRKAFWRTVQPFFQFRRQNFAKMKSCRKTLPSISRLSRNISSCRLKRQESSTIFLSLPMFKRNNSYIFIKHFDQVS